MFDESPFVFWFFLLLPDLNLSHFSICKLKLQDNSRIIQTEFAGFVFHRPFRQYIRVASRRGFAEPFAFRMWVRLSRHPRPQKNALSGIFS
jgi:hypothetical protein